MNNPIPALPFIDQYYRLTALNHDPHVYGLWLKTWAATLSQPFNPEKIPYMLEGWVREAPEESGMEFFYPQWGSARAGVFQVFKGVWRIKGVDYPKPSTINVFLTYLSEAGIKANFRPQWLEERGLR